MSKINEEFLELIVKATNKSKMDWCDIRIDKLGRIYFYDLENNKRLTQHNALLDIYDGVCDLQTLGFSKQDEDKFYDYMVKFFR